MVTNQALKVLVGDDEEINTEIVRRWLSSAGYECSEASRGDLAIEMMSHTNFGLVLLDINMPGQSGMKLLPEMNKRFPATAVIMMTGVDDTDVAVQAMRQGSFDYVVEPFDLADLTRRIGNALSRKKTVLREVQDKRLLQNQTARQAEELECKVREVTSLNRMFQADLSERFSTEEATYLKVLSQKERQVRRNIMSLHESAKKRISEYLHGHVQSKLLMLQQSLARCQDLLTLEPVTASNLLSEVRTDLQKVQEQDIRHASQELYPSIVRMGLSPALRSLRDRFWHSVQVELKIEPEIETLEEADWRLFPEEFKVAVYRIVEEALDNVVRHASASHVLIELSRDGNQHLCLRISDNGCGFETGKVSSVYGLLAIKDYADALGGICMIESAPGSGTRVCAMLRAQTDVAAPGGDGG